MEDLCQEITPLVKLPDQDEQKTLNTVYLGIEGMNCGNCVNRVLNSLLAVYGVTSVVIDLQQGLGEVRFNPELVTPTNLIEAVAAAGADGFHHYSAVILSEE
jgi:copper chaperone CopZ